MTRETSTPWQACVLRDDRGLPLEGSSARVIDRHGHVLFEAHHKIATSVVILVNAVAEATRRIEGTE